MQRSSMTKPLCPRPVLLLPLGLLCNFTGHRLRGGGEEGILNFHKGSQIVQKGGTRTAVRRKGFEDVEPHLECIFYGSL